MSVLKVDSIQNTGGTTAVTIDNSGYAFDRRPHFHAKQSAAQSVTNATYNQMQIDTSIHDTHNFVDLGNNRINFSADTAGIYQINIGAKWNNINASRVAMWVRRAGAQNTGNYIAWFEQPGASGSYLYTNYTFIHNFTATDFLAVDFWQNSGGSISTYTSGQDFGQFMSGYRIG